MVSMTGYIVREGLGIWVVSGSTSPTHTHNFGTLKQNCVHMITSSTHDVFQAKGKANSKHSHGIELAITLAQI